ncbi:MAG: putative motility protein [Alphaproteobacteria bacterium]|nr:putative motility protein [Alphaproteobacteria bacterium]
MSVDLAMAAVALNQAQTAQSVGIKMLKMQAEMQRSVVDLLAPAVEAAKAQTAPGTGTKVDKLA